MYLLMNMRHGMAAGISAVRLYGTLGLTFAAVTVTIGMILLWKVRAARRGTHAGEEELQTGRQSKSPESPAELSSRLKRAESEFLANISYEIRTPINAILGFTELTLATELDNNQRENLEAVRESTSDLIIIIDDILDYAKLAAGKLVLVPQQINLAQFIDEVLVSFRRSTAKTAVRIESRIDQATPPVIVADPARLRQVLSAIFQNAITYTQEGLISVSVEPLREKLLIGATQAATGLKPGGRNGLPAVVQFKIADTGIGISAEQQEQLFDYFSRTAGSNTRVPLGLSIAKQLVTLMGGKIWVESVPGEGAVFYFTIKTCVPEAARPDHGPMKQPEQSPAQYQRYLSQRPLRILLVDDKPTNLLITTRLLEREGHQLVPVSDGREAVQAIENGRFDCVLMDVQMPVMNGYEATRAIRTLEKKNGGYTPVIAMTAHALAGDREKCLESGMDDYIAKPVRIADLRLKLLKWGYWYSMDSQP